MTWQPSKQQLEDAARAGGKVNVWFIPSGTCVASEYPWQPHLPTTTQGKADLQDLQLAIPLHVYWMDNDTKVSVRYMSKNHESDVSRYVAIEDGNKHAALARAVLEVAAQVGEKMRGEA